MEITMPYLYGIVDGTKLEDFGGSTGDGFGCQCRYGVEINIGQRTHIPCSGGLTSLHGGGGGDQA
jgi:hypothetical protein